jgi:tocopherol O-methyltransferase
MTSETNGRPSLPARPASQHNDLVRRFYDIGSRYYSEICGEHIHDGYYLTGRESREQAQENLVRFLAAGAGIKARDRVLDVGCGIGGSSVWLARNLGASTLGITISPVQLNMARKKAAEQRADCAFLLMDAEDMHFDAGFDVIWAVAVCTHLPGQAGVIGAATRFLNPKGRFVIFDWMLGGSGREPGDECIDKVRRGMLLSSLHTMPEYLLWFTDLGYRIVSAEDITAFTIKTWDDALSLVRQVAVWKFVAELAANEAKHAINFLRSLGAMKEAMATDRLICGAIIAEKA